MQKRAKERRWRSEVEKSQIKGLVPHIRKPRQTPVTIIYVGLGILPFLDYQIIVACQLVHVLPEQGQRHDVEEQDVQSHSSHNPFCHLELGRIGTPDMKSPGGICSTIIGYN